MIRVPVAGRGSRAGMSGAQPSPGLITRARFRSDIVLETILLQYLVGGERHMFDGTHGMWGMHWFWWVFWILAIVSVVWVINRIQQERSASPRETPFETLQRRYAEGEMSTEEYEERKERLERDR